MIRLLLLTLWLVPHGLWATDTSSRTSCLAGICEFKAAFQAWDGKRFTHASELFQQATALEPNNITNFYWLGVAEFHLMLQLRSGPGKADQAEAAQAAAVEALTTAVKLDAHHAESHALLATIYGIRIGDRWIRALILGPQTMSHASIAMKEGAGNPRVRYLLATGEYYTASSRSDLEKALKDLLIAEEVFTTEATQASGPLEPRWGRSSCHTFIGLTYAKLGERKRAEAYFRLSLAEHPADHLARTSLNHITQTKPAGNTP